ncbi:MAG: outer membrane protein assembly factor BamE [Betaproteobacteria bacterium]|nr:outer membrane protein assembly factor BamE [Betaproteobacteria bacterium]
MDDNVNRVNGQQKHRPKLVVIAGVLSLALSVPAFAAGSAGGDAALTEQLKALQTAIKALSAKVDALQKKQTQAPAPSPQATEAAARQAVKDMEQQKARQADAWDSMKPGLSKAQVSALLGQPATRFSLNSNELVWYYTYPGRGSGSVIFGRDGKVTGSQKPPGMTFW